MFKTYFVVVTFIQIAVAEMLTDIVPVGEGLIGDKTILKNDMKKGEVVFKQKLSDIVHADGAAEIVFGENGGSEKHEISSILSSSRGEDENEETSTAYTPPHLLIHDDEATELAIAMLLIDKYNEWYHDHFIFTTEDVRQLSPGFQREFSLITKRADNWFSTLSKLKSSSWKSRMSTDDQKLKIKEILLWVSLTLRQRGLLSPFGTLISPIMISMRQAHSNCNVLTLHMPDDNTVIGVLQNDAKKGSEVCIAYSPSLSRQELLVRYYVWDEKIPIGIHYYVPEAEEEDLILKHFGCESGEIFLSQNGKLSDSAELCFRLAQLPSNVRSDHRELFKSKEAQNEAFAALGTLTLTALDSYYGVSDGGNFSFSETLTDNVESIFDFVDQRGDEGDMPPELIALIKEREGQQKGAADPQQEEEEEEEEVESITELESEDVIDIVPTPKFIIQLDVLLHSVVPELMVFLSNTHNSWSNGIKNIIKTRLSYDQAEAERIREQVRRNLEDYELSSDP